MLTWPIKSPGEVLDYAIDWSDRLAPSDAIKAATWIVPPGLTKAKDSVNGTTCTVWLSGGKMNNRFTIINRVETTSGRTIEQYVRLIVGAK